MKPPTSQPAHMQYAIETASSEPKSATPAASPPIIERLCRAGVIDGTPNEPSAFNAPENTAARHTSVR